jgi:hypothetical protein
MLHFVFFHWPQLTVDRGVYKERLMHFHERLREALPRAGYPGSVVFEMDNPPGVLFQGRLFSDWYAVNAWNFIERFKTTAVGEVVTEHNAVAQWMAGGAGAMYDVRGGTNAPPVAARSSYWFSKPPGMSYAALDAQLAPLIAMPDVTLWQRQLVLGPTPEFVLTSPEPLSLSGAVPAESRELTRC